MKNSPVLRVNASIHKRTRKARTDYAALLGTLSTQSAFFQTQPEVKSTGGAVIQAGTELAAAEAEANAAEAAAAAAAAIRDSKKVAFDQTYSVFTATVEKHAQTPEDLTSIGFDEREKNTYPLTAPLSVTATWNPTTETIDIDVKQAPGMPACFIEISPSPVGPNTWKRLTGVAASRSLAGYPPGTYWIRAAAAKGEDESSFTGPVSVIVK